MDEIVKIKAFLRSIRRVDFKECWRVDSEDFRKINCLKKLACASFNKKVSKYCIHGNKSCFNPDHYCAEILVPCELSIIKEYLEGKKQCPLE